MVYLSKKEKMEKLNIYSFFNTTDSVLLLN